MDATPVAKYFSCGGELHLFSLEALNVISVALNMQNVHSSANAAPSEYAKTKGAYPCENDVSASERTVVLHEGFTIEQWAAYAKRKAHIASAVCKQNGILKAQLAAGQHHEDASPESKGQFDGVFEQDPWIHASAGLKLELVPSQPNSESSLEEPWSQWRGTNNVPTTFDNHELDAASGVHHAVAAQEFTSSRTAASVRTCSCDAQLQTLPQNKVYDNTCCVTSEAKCKGVLTLEPERPTMEETFHGKDENVEHDAGLDEETIEKLKALFEESNQKMLASMRDSFRLPSSSDNVTEE